MTHAVVWWSMIGCSAWTKLLCRQYPVPGTIVMSTMIFNNNDHCHPQRRIMYGHMLSDSSKNAKRIVQVLSMLLVQLKWRSCVDEVDANINNSRSMFLCCLIICQPCLLTLLTWLCTYFLILFKALACNDLLCYASDLKWQIVIPNQLQLDRQGHRM